MTEREQLEAENQALYDQIAAAKTRREEVQARLAELDAEPDWGPAVEAFIGAYRAQKGNYKEDVRRSLIAAQPHFPVQVPFDVETFARAAYDKWWTEPERQVGYIDLARIAIHQTLKALGGAARWPSEAEVSQWAFDISLKLPCLPQSAALEMARRIRAYQTG